ncbi:MAG: crossover junction endodeoxyribonuclease RuvC [Pseudomonadota bacterium]
MSSSATRILGIDPGSRLTGFGVVDFEGDRARFVDAGVIKTGNGELSERLEVIFDATRELINRHQPDTLAVEQVFVSRNAGSALKLGAARSAAICASFGSGIALAEYSPREIKRAVTGTGAADKAQVQQMMRMLLSLDTLPQADAADALAVAVCHANASRLSGALAAAARRA